MSEFRRVYPGKNRVMFDGGMNSKFDTSTIEDNQSPDCKNVRFSSGGVGTRGGTTKLGTATVNTGAVGDGLYTRHTDTGSETMIVFAGGDMKYWSGSTFVTVPSAQSVFTAGNRVGAAEQEGHIFFCNGGATPYKYNGDFTRHGIYAPTTTSTVSSSATGLLTGDYVYKVTVVNSALVESDVGPATATFTAASGTLALASVPTFAASFGVASRRIYRTAASGTVFKRVGSIANNTATTFSDNIADAALGVNAPTDNGVPPLYNRIVYHASRLFMNDTNNPNFVVWTNIDTPYTVASVNFLKVGDNTSDLVWGIERFENHILVNCGKNQYIIYMPDTDPVNWVLQRVQSPYGSKSPYGCFEYDAKLMVPVMESGKFVGFAPLSGGGVARSTTFLTLGTIQSLLISNRIEPEMFEVQEGFVKNITSIIFKGIGYASLTHGDGNTTNNRVWVFDYSLDKTGGESKYAWSPDTGIEAAQFTIYDDKLYFVTSTAPCFVNQYETNSFNDNGVAIDSYFWTKEYTTERGANNQTFNDFRYMKLLSILPGDYDMRVNVKVDSDSGDGNVYDVNLNPGGSLWGTAVWGLDNWGGGSDKDDKKIFLGTTKGERIQFRFSNKNTINQKFEVQGLRFYYNQRGFR